VYSDKDERLLVDIEKLIKQTIARGELAGFAPSSSSASYASPRARDAGGVPERRSRRPGEGESAPRLAERPPRSSSSAPPPRREKVDPWFLKPYEPAVPVAPSAPAAPSAAKPARQKVAALLGGMRK
jgi:hypothetical protein